MVDPTPVKGRKVKQTGMITSLFTPPKINIKKPVSSSSDDDDSEDSQVNELASSDPRKIGSPSSDSVSAFSASS